MHLHNLESSRTAADGTTISGTMRKCQPMGAVIAARPLSRGMQLGSRSHANCPDVRVDMDETLSCIVRPAVKA